MSEIYIAIHKTVSGAPNWEPVTATTVNAAKTEATKLKAEWAEAGKDPCFPIHVGVKVVLPPYRQNADWTLYDVTEVARKSEDGWLNFNHVFSMSMSLKGFVDGHISEQDLQTSLLHFGCGKPHILNDAGEWPYEATWVNKETVDGKRFGRIRKHLYCDDKGVNPEYQTVTPDKVDPGYRDTIARFVELVRQADTEHRAFWKEQLNRNLLCRQLAERAPKAVVIQGGSRRPALEFA